MATQTHQFFTDRSKSPHNPSQLVSSSPYYKDPAEFTVHTQKHRSFCQATATVGAKSLVLLPVTVLEIEAGSRKVGALLPCGTRSPQAHRHPRPSRHVPPPHTTLVSPRADGSTAPHGLNLLFLYSFTRLRLRNGAAHTGTLSRETHDTRCCPISREQESVGVVTDLDNAIRARPGLRLLQGRPKNLGVPQQVDEPKLPIPQQQLRAARELKQLDRARVPRTSNYNINQAGGMRNNMGP